MEKIIITKHNAVKHYIISKQMATKETPCFSVAEIKDIEGKHVIGFIPLYLAAKAGMYTEIKINLKREDIKRELTLNEIEHRVKNVNTFKIEKINSREVF
jgi:two-component sensor histidine kinase